MKMKFTGLRLIRRQVGMVEWNRENGHVAETPVGLAANLLTQPGSEFLIQEATQDEMEELAKWTGVSVPDLRQYQARDASVEIRATIKNKRAKKEAQL
jgi:hypothetical protein